MFADFRRFKNRNDVSGSKFFIGIFVVLLYIVRLNYIFSARMFASGCLSVLKRNVLCLKASYLVYNVKNMFN